MWLTRRFTSGPLKEIASSRHVTYVGYYKYARRRDVRLPDYVDNLTVLSVAQIQVHGANEIFILMGITTCLYGVYRHRSLRHVTLSMWCLQTPITPSRYPLRWYHIPNAYTAVARVLGPYTCAG